MATIPASENEFPEVLLAEGAAPAAPGTGLVKMYAKADGLPYSKDDAGAESPMTPNAHIADTTDAHDASAVSVDPTGLTVVAGTDVQTAIEELDAGIAGGGIPATIIDAKGDLIAGTAADTAARVAAGTNGQALVARSGATPGVAWETPTGLLAVTRYAPTSIQIYTITGTSMADVDSTNLTVTFIAPASGNVLVRLHAFCDETAAGEGYWGLRESTTDLAVTKVIRNTGGEGPITTAEFYLTGISAGSHTYKWSAGVGASTTMRIIVQDGSAIGDFGPGIMTVWVAP